MSLINFYNSSIKKLDKPPTFDEVLQSIDNPIYVMTSINNRPLEVPCKELKVAHKMLHEILMQIIHEFKGAHAIRSEIESIIDNNTHFVHTDISKCFPSVTKDNALKFIHPLLNKLDTKEIEFATKALPTVFPNNKLSTGSPASPSILQAYLNDFPKIQNANVFRYVDDILIIGSEENSQEAFETLNSYLNKKNLTLSALKTYKGPIKDGFEFLGYSFGKEGNKIEKDININSFFPMQNWNPKFKLSFDSSSPSYENKDGSQIIYRADTIADHINKGSLEALLILTSSQENPDLKNYFNTMSSLVSKSFKGPLHSKLYQGYLANVSNPRKKGGNVVAHEADRVLAGLSVAVYIQKYNKLPKTFNDIIKAFPDVENAFNDSNTGSGNYHKAIKSLFKEEYQLRTSKSLKIHPNQNVLNQLEDSNDIFNELLNKDFINNEIPLT